MGFTDRKLQYRTIKCDAPGCPKEVEIELSDVKTIQGIEWLLGVRMVHTGDERHFAYCSDVCEVRGVTSGQQNVQEKPKIKPATEGDMKAAVAQAEGDARVNEALKTGEGEAKISLT